MPEVRMSLNDAAEALGIAPNSVRSRWKADKIKGERDNAGKIWVWIDTDKAANDAGSKSAESKPSKDISKASIEGSKDGEIKALQDHIKTLSEQLATANSELAQLRPLAAAVERLEAENKGLSGQLEIRAEQLAELRQLMAEAKVKSEEELRRYMETPRAKGFFARLFAR